MFLLRSTARQILTTTRLQIRRAHFIGYNPQVRVSKFQYYPPLNVPTHHGLNAWALERSTFLIRNSKSIPGEVRAGLLRVQELIASKQNSLAIAHFLKMLGQQPLSLYGIVTSTDLAIWMFVHANDMHSAIIVLNEIVEHGIPILVTTLMTLSRGGNHDPRHKEQVRNAFLGSLADLNELAFVGLMRCLQYLDATDELVFAFETYRSLKPADWISAPAVYSIIIRGFSRTNDMVNARVWLDKYRESLRKMDTLSKSKPVTTSKFDRSVAWKTELDNAKRFSPDRHMNEAFPYQVYLYGLFNTSKPQLDELQTVVTQMKEDNIRFGRVFCNNLIGLYRHWQLYPQVIAGYTAMLESPSHIFPDARTYDHMFRMMTRIARFATEKSDRTGFSYGLHLRTVFREMITIDTARLSIVTGKIRDEVVSRQNLSQALKAFTDGRDYPAALVVLQFLKKYDYIPDQTIKSGITAALGPETLEHINLKKLHGK
ncbi:hypothetical protein M422DRAFT_252526 [Sphaerobolus stellatus SS14]|uniref:Uncharacterized protein n=1 Tax=Sphaerobolus stellatus (strain SS14) TaxID=990650 RepID=A0A0C9VZP3_SPHS4|nr:hypothetical protein M422DRAFT_252526 [Sphaerobolus stellatus SS14]